VCLDIPVFPTTFRLAQPPTQLAIHWVVRPLFHADREAHRLFVKYRGEECKEFYLHLSYALSWRDDNKRGCVFRVTGFLDFVHRPIFYKLGNATFRKLGLFPSSGELFLRDPTE
jgi:hypothetical protein